MSTERGVILYGPPASGKDSVGRELHAQDASLSPFRRLKSGGEIKPEYRIVSSLELEDLKAEGEIIWSNHRYLAEYAVDRSALLGSLADYVPVLHLGQVEAVAAVQDATPNANWLTVELWCPREVAEVRLRARSPDHLSERLRAWDETQRLPCADLRIDTQETPADDAARAILRRLSAT